MNWKPFALAAVLCATLPLVSCAEQSSPALANEPMFTDLLQETSPLGTADRNAYYVQTANHVAPSEPECDGRGVLIVSTVRLMSEDVPSELTKALEATPGAEFTYPGQCASLRTREGIDALYPVYLDFGDDIEGLCAAVDKHPGSNARLLTNENDYGTPCPAR